MIHARRRRRLASLLLAPSAGRRALVALKLNMRRPTSTGAASLCVYMRAAAAAAASLSASGSSQIETLAGEQPIDQPACKHVR